MTTTTHVHTAVPVPVPVKNAGLAAVLSFVLPGLGQLYNGQFFRALFWFIVGGGLWAATMGLFGWIAHILAAATAYYQSTKINRRRGLGP